MKKDNNVKCVSCGSVKIKISIDLRYNGLRAVCLNCGHNWPES